MTRGRRTTLLAVLALVQWAWLAKAVPQLHGNDFGIFYRSARSITPYAGDAGNPVTESGEPMTNLNPPHFLLVLKPFGLLPLGWACFVWWVMSAALVAAGLTWWLRTHGEGWTPERVVWALLWVPIYTLGFTGQVTPILGVPLWFAYRDLKQGENLRGGVLAGLVLSVKPILWPLGLWYVARKGWSTVTGMAVGFVGAIATGMAVFGFETYREWLGALREITWTPEVMNASVAAIASRLPFSTPVSLSTAAGMAIGLLTIWRTRKRAIEEAWMPLVAASLLASPLGWVYYGVWLLPGTKIDDWTRGVALGWCAPLLVVGLIGNIAAPFWPTLGSCYGWTLLVLWYRSTMFSAESVDRKPVPSTSLAPRGQWPRLDRSQGLNASGPSSHEHCA